MINQEDHGTGTATISAPLGVDYTLCECAIEPLKALVTDIEALHQVNVKKSPSICLAMVPAQDSLEAQKFYLGEALATECEVEVDGHQGFGLCLGEEPVRAYCLAVLDALLFGGAAVPSQVEAFLREQERLVAKRDQDEFDLILQTQVDFKLMEEA